MKIKILLLLGYLALGGCVSNQHFDCPQVGGVRCQSMSEIDKMIDMGQLGNKLPYRKYSLLPKTRYYIPTHTQPSPKRSSEEVVQIWIGAYESADGIYHHPAMLNVVVRPAKWNSS